MDGSFDEIDVTSLTDTSIGWIYRSIRGEYLSGHYTLSFTSPQGLVGYVESLDDSVIVELFEGHDKPTLELDCETIIRSVLEKKHHLMDDFKAYYETLAESVDRAGRLLMKRGPRNSSSESTEAYQRQVVEFLKERISTQRRFLNGEAVDFL